MNEKEALERSAELLERGAEKVAALVTERDVLKARVDTLSAEIGQIKRASKARSVAETEVAKGLLDKAEIDTEVERLLKGAAGSDEDLDKVADLVTRWAPQGGIFAGVEETPDPTRLTGRSRFDNFVVGSGE